MTLYSRYLALSFLPLSFLSFPLLFPLFLTFLFLLFLLLSLFFYSSITFSYAVRLSFSFLSYFPHSLSLPSLSFNLCLSSFSILHDLFFFLAFFPSCYFFLVTLFLDISFVHLKKKKSSPPYLSF